jgi:hypothetical protein
MRHRDVLPSVLGVWGAWVVSHCAWKLSDWPKQECGHLNGSRAGSLTTLRQTQAQTPPTSSARGQPPFFLFLTHHPTNQFSTGKRTTSCRPITPAVDVLSGNIAARANAKSQSTTSSSPSAATNLRRGQSHSTAAMASQQVLFGETIAAMKKAIKRTAYGTALPVFVLPLHTLTSWSQSPIPTTRSSTTQIAATN